MASEMSDSSIGNYPLHNLLQVKQHRLQSAERNLAQANRLLEEQKHTLTELEREKLRIEEHRLTHLEELRNKLDSGTTTHVIEQLKSYLDVVVEQLSDKQLAVDRQKQKVEQALERVRFAERRLAMQQKEMEKMNTHQHIWKKAANEQLLAEEALEHDELGNSQHIRQRDR